MPYGTTCILLLQYFFWNQVPYKYSTRTLVTLPTHCNRILSSKINFMENNNHLPVFDITIAIENVEGWYTNNIWNTE